MTHQYQQNSYNAGWNKGRWPNDPIFNTEAKNWNASDFAEGLRDGRKARDEADYLDANDDWRVCA